MKDHGGEIEGGVWAAVGDDIYPELSANGDRDREIERRLALDDRGGSTNRLKEKIGHDGLRSHPT